MKATNILLAIACGVTIVQFVSQMNDTKTEHDQAMSAIVKEITLSQRPRVIEITAPGCGACAAFAPVFKSVSSKYSLMVDFRQVVWGTKEGIQFCDAFGIHSTPCTVLLDREGNLKQTIEGTRSQAEFDKLVASVI